MYLPVINCGINKHTGYKNQAQVRSNSMHVHKWLKLVLSSREQGFYRSITCATSLKRLSGFANKIPWLWKHKVNSMS